MHKVMEFILPILSASGEAVIFSLILIVLFVIGRGRMLPSEKTLVIERPGHYAMVLAPGLNLAQPFIEAIARQMPLNVEAGEGAVRLHLEVRDKEVATAGRPAYHLAVLLDHGVLRFEARRAPGDTETSGTSGAFPSAGSDLERHVEEVARLVAKVWGVGLTRIDNPRQAV